MWSWKYHRRLVLPLSEADISTSHRVGRPQPSKPRPIVARFVRRDTRTMHFTCGRREQLRDTEYTRTLCWVSIMAPSRAKLLHVVKRDEETEKVWTVDCKIFCTLKEGSSEEICTFLSRRLVQAVRMGEGEAQALRTLH